MRRYLTVAASALVVGCATKSSIGDRSQDLFRTAVSATVDSLHADGWCAECVRVDSGVLDETTEESIESGRLIGQGVDELTAGRDEVLRALRIPLGSVPMAASCVGLRLAVTTGDPAADSLEAARMARTEERCRGYDSSVVDVAFGRPRQSKEGLTLNAVIFGQTYYSWWRMVFDESEQLDRVEIIQEYVLD